MIFLHYLALQHIYQDSLYGIWPDTITNLDVAYQGVAYNQVIDIKTPSTLIEAAAGDSSITVIDTLGQQFYIGDWPVDNMELIDVLGMPNGLSYGCDIPNCVLPGDFLACAYIDGTTNDPPAVYPITIVVNLYTNGILDLGFLQIPVATDLYTALGEYEEITGYNLVISDGTGLEIFNSQSFSLLQNIPNPSNGNTEIRFNTPTSDKITLSVTNMFGSIVYSEEIESVIGLNSVKLTQDLPIGIYNYSIMNKSEILSKMMLISE